jgi:dolichyl-phosphate beta-glucosyltransferase
MLAARGARRLFMDADGSTSLSEVTRLMAALDQGADISFGSRALESAEVTIDARWYRRYPGRIFNWCVNNILSLGFADTQCGFKLFTANAADQVFGKQESLQFGFDLELLYVGQRLGLKLTEVPVNWRNVPGSKVRVIRDGLRMLQDAFSIRARHQSLTR